MNFLGNLLFDKYKSSIRLDASTCQEPPPVGVRVVIKSYSLGGRKNEYEAMRVYKFGTKTPRWQIFNYYGTQTSYPHRNWQPDSWREI